MKKIYYFFGLIILLYIISPVALAQVSSIRTQASSSSQASEVPDKGFTIFSENCAVCHTIGAGDDMVPDLKGVTLRRAEAWLRSFIRFPSKMIEEKNPTAMELLAKYKEPMSDTGLTEEEVNAVIEYLKEVDAAAESTQDPQAVTRGSNSDGRESSPGQDKEDKRFATKAEVDKGRALFQGTKRFLHEGPSCFSCHDMRSSTFMGGGRLAKELVTAYSRLGEARVSVILEKSPFPLMRESYQENPLTRDEIVALAAFLEQAGKEQGNQQPTHDDQKMFFTGLAGLAVLLRFYGAFWSNRKNKPVNKDIYDHQIKSEDEM